MPSPFWNKHFLKKLLFFLIIISLTASIFISLNLYSQNKTLRRDEKKYNLKEKRLSNRINSLMKSANLRLGDSESSKEKSGLETSSKKSTYKNEEYAFIVNYPKNWNISDSANKDGFMAQRGTQKIIVYGVADNRGDKNINKYLESEYGSAILFKEIIKAVNVEGMNVSTEMEQFLIFKSWKNFVIIYTELPADESTINEMETIAKSFQVLGE